MCQAWLKCNTPAAIVYAAYSGYWIQWLLFPWYSGVSWYKTIKKSVKKKVYKLVSRQHEAALFFFFCVSILALLEGTLHGVIQMNTPQQPSSTIAHLLCHVTRQDKRIKQTAHLSCRMNSTSWPEWHVLMQLTQMALRSVVLHVLQLQQHGIDRVRLAMIKGLLRFTTVNCVYFTAQHGWIVAKLTSQIWVIWRRLI